jgi:hypothetical protein
MSRRTSPLIGIWRVATGRADGLDGFGATTHAFLSSLAPLIAFPLVFALIAGLEEGLLAALSLLGFAVIAQLAPPVASHALAQRWDREQHWLHYATAYNWCYWALPVVATVLKSVFSLAVRAGLSQHAAAAGFLLTLAGYGLWLHWFLARHGLALSRLRAALLVIIVNTVTLALALGPLLLV